MSVSSEITRIQNAKASLKTSINAKTDSQHQITTETIDDYADFVDSIQTGGQPNLQTKSVTITTNGNTVVTADSGYDGLDEVDITTNVSGGGDVPTKGVVLSNFDSNGYPTVATYYGVLSQQNYFNNSGNGVLKNLQTINIANDTTSTTLPSSLCYMLSFLTSMTIPSQITIIGANVFQNCTHLQTLTLPSNLQTIQANAFHSCSNLVISQLPSTVKAIDNNAFYSCSSLGLTELPSGLTSLGQGVFRSANISIKTIPDGITYIYKETFTYANMPQISMSNVEGIVGTRATDGGFAGNTSLKAVWIGSAITSAGFSRYSFAGCSNLAVMYIDLPRATVEAFANYNYAFMNNASKVGIIICNDDAGFMTKAEFDAIDWSTYTP